MKFKINSKVLLGHLNRVVPFLASNPVLPIVENVLFEVMDDNLYLTITDLENTITSKVGFIQSSGDFSACIPARILLDTVKTLGNQELQFELEEIKTDLGNSYSVYIKAGRSKCKTAGELSSDFPKTETIVPSSQWSITGSDLKSLIEKTIYTASNDELRPAMTGVYFSEGEAVATDAHSLSLVKTGSMGVSSVIVSSKTLNKVKSVFALDDEIKVYNTKSNICFTSEDVKINCRLIDARYPDYKSILPTDFTTNVRIERKPFEIALKRLLIFANKTTNQIVCNFDGETLTATTQDLDFSNEASEQLDIETDGTPLKIGFNAKIVLSTLSAMDGEKISIEMTTPNKAAIFKPLGNDEHMALVMPVMIS